MNWFGRWLVAFGLGWVGRLETNDLLLVIWTEAVDMY